MSGFPDDSEFTEMEINRSISLVSVIEGDLFTSHSSAVQIDFTGEIPDKTVERAMDRLSDIHSEDVNWEIEK